MGAIALDYLQVAAPTGCEEAARSSHGALPGFVRARHGVAWARPGEIPGRSRFHVADPWGNRVELLAAEGG